MSVRLKRLYNEYQEITQVFLNHQFITIKSTVGNPPEKYFIEYKINGLVQNDNNIIGRNLHSVEIILPAEYPSLEPICRMVTPVFHPNVDFNKICIADYWAAGESLIDVIIRIGEIICYQNYNIKSPLNGEAAKWAEQNINRFPIDLADLNVERQLLKKIIKPVEKELPNKDLVEKACSNCGAHGSDIRFKKCSNGHFLCPDCVVECKDCGKALCILCSSNKCIVCGKVLCKKCQNTCTLCGNITCKDDVCSCHVCQCGVNGRDVKLNKCSNGHFACPDCIIECKSCGKILCLSCSFNKCSYCGEIFCNDCHKVCPSNTTSKWVKPELAKNTITQAVNKSLKNNINDVNDINKVRSQQQKKYKLCKKCGYTNEDIEANFCEMCGEKFSN